MFNLFMNVPSKDLHFKRNISWVFFGEKWLFVLLILVELLTISLFKLSFHNTIKHAEFLYITFFWFIKGTHISFKYLYTKFFLLIIQ